MAIDYAEEAKTTKEVVHEQLYCADRKSVV